METNVFHGKSKFSLTETRRRGAHRAIFIALFVVILLMGCNDSPNHNDTGFIPVGVWTDGWGSGYNITETTIKYYTPDYGEEYPATIIIGNIEKAIDFSHNSGVLIIKITSQTDAGVTVGKYTATYYREYTSSHSFLANPVDEMYNPIEVNSLNAAINTFTVDNVDTHVTHWGSGYTK